MDNLRHIPGTCQGGDSLGKLGLHRKLRVRCVRVVLYYLVGENVQGESAGQVEGIVQHVSKNDQVVWANWKFGQTVLKSMKCRQGHLLQFAVLISHSNHEACA